MGDDLQLVSWLVCDLCLDGSGGECHTPGCAFYLNRAPDLPMRDVPGADEIESLRATVAALQAELNAERADTDAMATDLREYMRVLSEQFSDVESPALERYAARLAAAPSTPPSDDTATRKRA